MKKAEIILLQFFSLALASTGFADTGNSACSSSLLWLFISFGALIVVAQLIPAILVIIGFIRGFPIKHKTGKAVKDEK